LFLPCFGISPTAYAEFFSASFQVHGAVADLHVVQ
jgi:hypothetical protein